MAVKSLEMARSLWRDIEKEKNFKPAETNTA
jgi:hypothetical protein